MTTFFSWNLGIRIHFSLVEINHEILVNFFVFLFFFFIAHFAITNNAYHFYLSLLNLARISNVFVGRKTNAVATAFHGSKSFLLVWTVRVRKPKQFKSIKYLQLPS